MENVIVQHITKTPGVCGGKACIAGHRIRVKPTAGALVIFGAGPEYVHGITRVTKGLRYTYAGWFTYDQKFEDPNAPKVF